MVCGKLPECLSWEGAEHQVQLEASKINGCGAPGGTAPTMGPGNHSGGTTRQRLFPGQAEETLRLRNTTSTPTSAKPPTSPYTVPIPANSGFFCCPMDKAGHSKNSHGFQTHFHPPVTEQKGSLVARVPDLCSSVLTYFPDLL